MRIISQKGIDFITAPGRDSFEAKPYICPGGKWTVAFGQVITAAQAKAWKEGITLAKGKELLAAYLESQQKKLNKLPLQFLLQHQWDAVSSLAYNIGYDNFCNSTVYVRIVTHDGDLTPWLWWNKAKGKVAPGLVRRREDELRLFLYGIY